MYVSLWLNAVAAVQMLYIEHIFVFFMTSLLKMEIILSARKPHYHSRLSKPNLKILSSYRKKNQGNKIPKQYVLNTFPDCLMTRISNNFFKIKYDVKVVKLFTDVLRKSCSDELYGKHLCRSLFLNKVSHLLTKERLIHR